VPRTRKIKDIRPDSLPESASHSRRAEGKAALKDAAPLAIQVAVAGLAFGITAEQSGLTWLETCAMSVLVFAGAAQFAAVGILSLGNFQPGSILLATLLINLRHLLYGVSLAPYFKPFNLRTQMVLAFGITDESYALIIARFLCSGSSVVYPLTANTVIYLGWFIASGTGALVGGKIENPAAWGVDFIMPACFLALLIPLLRGWKEILAGIAAGTLAVAGMNFAPGSWSIICAAVAAALIGMGMEKLCD
jgi:4-azaleucine resistance transporter AzlC